MSKKREVELLSKTDKKFLIGASLALSLFSLLLYFNYQEATSSSQKKQIGTLVVKRNVVQRKPEAQVIWKSISQSYPIYEMDTIRTGKESEAVLHLTGKFKIDVDENTLILLDFLDDAPVGRVQLKNGSARFRQDNVTEGKTLKLEILDKDQNFTLSGAGELFVNRNAPNKKLELGALNDKVKLTNASGIEEMLTPDSLFALSEEKISKQKLAVVPQKPKDGANITGPGQNIPVNLSWKASPKIQKIRIEISKYSNLSRPLLRKELRKSSFTTKLRPGLYYWRLSGATGQYSITHKFRVLSRSTVKLHKPLANSVFSYFTEEPFISFSWSRASEASAYLLEVAKDKKFKNFIIQKNTLSVNYGTSLPQGKYYWRVTAKGNLTSSETSSQAKSFAVSRYQKKITIPLDLNLSPGQTLDKRALAKKGFVLSWKDNPEVAHTELLVSEDPKFSQTIIKKKVSRNFYNMKMKLSKPVYYYKLRFYNKEGKVLSSSPARSFKIKSVKIPAPSLLNLSPGQTLDKKFVDKKGFVFKWKSHPEVANTEVIVAEDPKFSQIVVKKKVSENSYHMKTKLSKPLYYYKLKSYDEEGEILSSSPVLSFKVGKVKIKLTSLRVLRPGNNASFDKRKILTSGIRFSWTKPKVKSEFQFLLAKSRNFAKPILKQKVKKNSLLTKIIQKNGNYFWKVTALDFEDGSTIGETKVTSFTVQQLPLIEIEGIGEVRGRIISRGENAIKISTSKGVIMTTQDKIIGVQHDY